MPTTWSSASNFVIGGALPSHPVFDGETFTLQLYGRSVAPSATALLDTYQVDVWKASVTWDPPDALEVSSFTWSSSWRNGIAKAANGGAASAANGADGLVILVDRISIRRSPTPTEIA